MKRAILFIFLFLSLLTLSGCKNDKKEYKLIELQSSEYLDYIKDNENANIILAVYDSTESNAVEFLDNLNKAVGNIYNNVYYVDLMHMDINSIMNVSEYLYCNYSYNCYMVLSNGKVKVSEIYTNMTQLVKDLKNIGITEDEIPKIDRNTKLEYLKEAEREYEKGNIGIAVDNINKAWDLQEAKEMYAKNEYNNLINTWEGYHVYNSKTNEAKYFILDFYPGVQEIYYYEKDGKIDELENKPYSDVSIYYYRLEDDIIYVKKDENSSKYKEKYRIMYVTEDRLQLKDLDSGNIYNCVRRTEY